MTHEEFVNFIRSSRKTADDQTAVKAMAFYPYWEEGMEVSIGDRLQYGGKLYNVIQSHTTQADWTPDITPAIYTLIDVERAGTIEDPIPAVAGMEYEYGKYYIEDETIYVCQRTGEAAGGKITLYYLPSQLVGQYFEVV